MSVSIGIETKVAAVPAAQKVRAVLVIDEPDITPFLAPGIRNQLRDSLANLFSALFKVRPHQLQVTFEDEVEEEEPPEKPAKPTFLEFAEKYAGHKFSEGTAASLAKLIENQVLPLPKPIDFSRPTVAEARTWIREQTTLNPTDTEIEYVAAVIAGKPKAEQQAAWDDGKYLTELVTEYREMED